MTMDRRLLTLSKATLDLMVKIVSLSKIVVGSTCYAECGGREIVCKGRRDFSKREDGESEGPQDQHFLY